MLRRRPAGSPSLLYHPQVVGAGGSGSEPISDHRNGIEWRASLPSLSPLQRILLTMPNALGDWDDSRKHAAVGVASRIETRELREGEEAEWDRFVMSSATGTFFHLSGWHRMVQRDPRTSLFLPGGRLWN